MDDIKEKKLIKLAKSGDINAFEELIIEHEQIVYNIIYKLMNNHQDTYDLSQETFIKVFTKIKQFDNKSKFSTWVYRIATNTCLDELRKRKRLNEVSIDKPLDLGDEEVTKEQEDKTQNIEETILEKEQKTIIEQALDELNETQKTVIILRDIQGLAYDEIAEILNISLGTVKSRISRARIELKRILMQDKEPFSTYFRQITRREDRA